MSKSGIGKFSSSQSSANQSSGLVWVFPFDKLHVFQVGDVVNTTFSQRQLVLTPKYQRGLFLDALDI